MAKRKQPLPLEERVLQFIKAKNLVSPRQKLLVAVSGGPDSVCLFNLLVRLQDALKIKLHVAHLDHQLRAESGEDARYVADLAKRLGIPVTIEQRDVKAYQAEHRLSLEEAARGVRYAFLGEVASLVGVERVAVGHTLDDHIETILMHIIRGTGTKGLRGLQPIVDWKTAGNGLIVIRPLLEVTREETQAYCRRHKLMPRTDVTNLSLSLFRNRIRLELLPELKKYNPGIIEALLRTAKIASDDFDFIESEAARLWKSIAQKQDNTLILDKKKLLKSPDALKRQVLRMAIESLLGTLKDIETKHIEEVLEALTKPAGKKITLPEGLIFSIEYDRFLLSREPEALSPFPPLGGEFKLKVPGETRLPGWRIEVSIIESTAMGKPEGDKFTAYFDFARTGNKLAVRTRRRGDHFQPFGLPRPKRLAEFMIDAKIPQSWRDNIPIVCSPEQILWVVGWRIDDRVKVTKETKRVLKVRFERE